MSTFIEIPASKRSLSLRKLICNIGINDATYKTQPSVNNIRSICPYFSVWKDMIRRCYDPKNLKRFPTYKGCSVCSEWLLFSNFKLWMQKQDWKGKQLDKDLLIRGNKVYSPKTCLFVSHAVNSLFCDSKALRGIYPIGIYLDIHTNKYRVKCSVNNKSIHLGSFNSLDEAQKIYKEYKKQVILSVASVQININIKHALEHIAQTEY